jgi:hypothetical protein
VTDVWDLIWFNFDTDEPREVNWYMPYYVGCWQSNDGKNFSFRDADPGIVYMLPLGYKRPATLVADMLSAKSAHFPYVAYKHVHIDRTYLLSVIRHIRSRRIKVRIVKLRKDELAAHGDDTFWLNFDAPPRGFREGPLGIEAKAAALARHIIADKAGGTFIRLDDYVDVAPFQNLKSEIIKTHPKIWNDVIRGDGV